MLWLGMAGFFDQFKKVFREQTPTFHKVAKRLFGGKTLDAESVEDLEEALYEADFGVETTEEIIGEIQQAYRKDKNLRGRAAAEIGAAVLKRVLAGAGGEIDFAQAQPLVVALVGVNGSGKTTTTAKLAARYQSQGKTVLMGACDTFRAAANEQIRAWADRLDVPLVSSQHGADAAAVAYDALHAAQARKTDVLLLDTAGRLHTKDNLMNELKKVRRVCQKLDPTAPQHAWLVVDGSLGTNSIEQARVFHREFNLTGLIITKLDGTSRGGALAGIYRELQLPIFYVGLGESAEDLKPFDPEAYAEAIFGLDAEAPATA